MSELDKLEAYLKENNYKYERIDEDERKLKMSVCSDIDFSRHQIIVYDETDSRIFDVICQYGSYGYQQGLLEVMGVIVKDESDDVEGWLSAEEVIKRMEELREWIN